MKRINELVSEYPNVNLENEPKDVVYEMATRWLRWQSEQLARATTRSMEREHRDPGAATAQRDAYISKEIESIVRKAAARMGEAAERWSLSLLAQTFMVGGKAVSWGDATLAQHEMRVTGLHNQSVGIAETASLHVRAVNELRAARVTTLNELETKREDGIDVQAGR